MLKLSLTGGWKTICVTVCSRRCGTVGVEVGEAVGPSSPGPGSRDIFCLIGQRVIYGFALRKSADRTHHVTQRTKSVPSSPPPPLRPQVTWPPSVHNASLVLGHGAVAFTRHGASVHAVLSVLSAAFTRYSRYLATPWYSVAL